MRLAAPRHRAAEHLLVVLAYLLLALLFTWPLVLHPASRAPGLERFEGKDVACDTWNQAWSLWWTREALADRSHLIPGESLHETRHLFYPVGTTLALHTLFPLYGVAAMPITIAAGPVLAWNAVLWMILALSGWATWRFSRRWGPAPGAIAFIIGGAVAFSPYVMAHVAAGHLNLAGVFWLPLYLDFFLVALGFAPTAERAPARDDNGGASRLRAGLASGLLLAACAWTELYYVAFLLAASAAMLIAAALLSIPARRRELLPTAWRPLLAAAIVFLLGASPVFMHIAGALRGGGPFMSVRGYGFAAADLLSYVAPGRGTTIFMGTLDPIVARLTSLPQEWTLFPGYAFLAFTVVGLRLKRAESALGAVLGWIALFFVVLSLGIYLKIGGRSEWTIFGATFRIPLPYLAATHLPLFGNLRSTGRFGIMALVLAAPIAARGLRAFVDRVPAPRRTTGLAAAALVLCAERIIVPLPLQDGRIASVYSEIARDPGDFAVLEVPFGLRDGSWIIGREVSRMQLYQTAHRHPLLSGCVSRMREEVPRWFGEQPLTRSLIKFESAGSLAPEDMEFDRMRAASWARETHVKYILVHTELAAPGRDYRALARYLAGVTSPVEVRETTDGIIVLRLY